MLQSNTTQTVVFACSCVICCQGACPLLQVHQHTPLPEIFLSNLHSLCNKRDESDSGTQLVFPVKVDKSFHINRSWCNNMTTSHSDQFLPTRAQRLWHQPPPASARTAFISSCSTPELVIKAQRRETPPELNRHTPIICAWPYILLLHSSPTHPCRQTAPLSWSTARWAGCSSPPCPPAEPYHR